MDSVFLIFLLIIIFEGQSNCSIKVCLSLEWLFSQYESSDLLCSIINNGNQYLNKAEVPGQAMKMWMVERNEVHSPFLE